MNRPKGYHGERPVLNHNNFRGLPRKSKLTDLRNVELNKCGSFKTLRYLPLVTFTRPNPFSPEGRIYHGLKTDAQTFEYNSLAA